MQHQQHQYGYQQRQHTPSHSRQTSRSGRADSDENDADDIVGSYLNSNFLNEWSTINTGSSPSQSAFHTATSSAQDPLRTWTPPSLAFKSHSSTAPGPSSIQQSTMASSYGQVPPAPAPAPIPAPSTRTVRKSSSGRKLKPQTSLSNMATTTTTLPDPSLFPDPYPSYNSAAAAPGGGGPITPPVSLFSAGSSSARSSAYASASPASALRSSVASSDSAHNARAAQQQQQQQQHLQAVTAGQQFAPPHLPSPTRLSGADSMIMSLHPFLDHSEAIHHFAYSSPALDSPSPHHVGVASTADESVQLMDMDQPISAVTARPSGPHHPSSYFGGSGSSRPGSRPATMADDQDTLNNNSGLQTRWSSSSAASQSSSWGNFDPNGANGHGPQEQRNSGVVGGNGNDDPEGYEWNHHPERDEDYRSDDDENHEEDDMDRTAAILLAEQGHGEIVNGAGKDVNELHVPMNTTHLLLGQSATPTYLPGFLMTALPPISHSLLALDISGNNLTALPPPLAACRGLEELNVGCNPLRILPTWLAVLTNLRVLIADSIGISTVPPSLSGLVQLHTLSVRNNRMFSLPSWLCLLPVLETLYLEGNPFQGPWKALVEPLTTRLPMTPSARSLYPPNTPRTMNSIESTDHSEYGGEEKHDDTLKGANLPPLQLGLGPAPAPVARGHRTNSSRDFSSSFSKAPAPSDRPSTAGGPVRSRALTLDRDTELARGSQQRIRATTQEQRPHTSFGGQDHSSSRTLSRTKTAPSRRPSASSTSISSQAALPSDASNYKLGRDSPASFASRAPSDDRLAAQGSGNGGDDRTQSPNNNGTVRKMKSTGDVKMAAMNSAYRTSEVVPNEMGGADPNSGLGKFMSVGARGPMKEEYRALTATMFETPSAPAAHTPGVTPAAARGAGKEKKWGFFKKMSKSRLRSGSTANEDEAYAAIVSQPLGPPRNMGGMGGPSNTEPIQQPHSSASNYTPGLERPLTASHVAFRSSTNLTQTSPQRRVLSKRPSDAHHVSTMSNSMQGPSTPSTQSMFSKSTPSLPSQPSTNVTASTGGLLAPPGAGPTPRKAKRRSFLPLGGPTPLSIPSSGNSMLVVDGANDTGSEYGNRESGGYISSPLPMSPMDTEEKERERHQRALRSVMGYLRDMCDLSAGTSSGATAVAAAAAAVQAQVNASPNFGQVAPQEQQPHHEGRSRSGPSSRSVSRRPTLSSADASRALSEFSNSSAAFSGSASPPNHSSNPPSMFATGPTPSFTSFAEMSAALESETATIVDEQPIEEKKVKDDKNKRSMIVKEIVTTERTYVKLLQELVDIYVKPAAAPVTGIANVSTKETIVPPTERKIVFNGLESLLSFHKESFLPSLEKAYQILESSSDADGKSSAEAAVKVAQVFVSHAAFMRMYSTYINNFDNALRRTKQWTDKNLAAAVMSASASSASAAGGGLSEANSQANLTPAQRKRIKQYLKRCRANPRHSQMNMESYLLLPVQRIPRYRLLFEELVRATPQPAGSPENVLQRALDEISTLASNMNEGKREAETRRKLVHWQGRIRGKFPSPLVQPHRRLIMDGRLQLTRVVRKIADYFEVIGTNGEKALVSVECLAPEVTPRALTAILCNDLLVLCKDPSGGKDVGGPVDLWAVLRMQTVSQPASIVHGSTLRLVDNKAILYFDIPSSMEADTWSRAINMHIPASTK